MLLDMSVTEGSDHEDYKGDIKEEWGSETDSLPQPPGNTETGGLSLPSMECSNTSAVRSMLGSPCDVESQNHQKRNDAQDDSMIKCLEGRGDQGIFRDQNLENCVASGSKSEMSGDLNATSGGKSVARGHARKGKKNKTRKADRTALEDKVLEWILNRQKNGETVSPSEVRIEAYRVAKELNIKGFVGSQKWVFHFRKTASAKCEMPIQFVTKKPIKRQSVKNDFKVTVVKCAEVSGTSDAAKKYNVSRSQIHNWRKQKDELERNLDKKSLRRGSSAKWPELEIELLKWIKQQHEVGEIRVCEILAEATRIAKEMNLDDFSGSKQWLLRFRKRHGVTGIAYTRVKGIRRHHVRNDVKLKILKCAEEIGIRAAARKYGVSLGSIHRWQKVKEKLENHSEMMTLRQGKPAAWPELESMLLAWFLKQQEDGEEVQASDLRAEGMRLAKLMNIQDFRATIGWMTRFMDRSRTNCKMLSVKKRAAFSEDFKLSVVEHAEKFGRRSASNKYGVTEKLLGEWCRNKDGITRKLENKNEKRKKKRI